MEIQDNTIIQATKESVFTEIEEESTILNTKTGMYYGLNQTGTLIWEFIQQPATFKEIIVLVLNHYDIEKKICRKDITRLLLDMHKESLIIIDNNE